MAPSYLELCPLCSGRIFHSNQMSVSFLSAPFKLFFFYLSDTLKTLIQTSKIYTKHPLPQQYILSVNGLPFDVLPPKQLHFPTTTLIHLPLFSLSLGSISQTFVLTTIDFLNVNISLVPIAYLYSHFKHIILKVKSTSATPSSVSSEPGVKFGDLRRHKAIRLSLNHLCPLVIFHLVSLISGGMAFWSSSHLAV